MLGVQRPDAKVITGQIKTNVPVRICGRFADNSASEIVLSNTKAKDLQDIKGRFLIKVGADTEEFQAYYFDDEKHLKDINRKVGDLLIEGAAAALESNSTDNLEDDQFVMQDNLGDSIIDETYEADDEFESGNIDWDSLKENKKLDSEDYFE